MKRAALTAIILLEMSTGMMNTDVSANDNQHDYDAVDTYRQVLVLTTSDASTALAPPQLAAVFDGRQWGLSTRWDDSNPNALNVRRQMLENGIRGTFYLNSREPETQSDSLAHKLTGKGECSVGGHSVTHPHLPQLSANEAFFELMANRITLECLTDRPVNSLAFPFGDYQDKNRPETFEGITAAVLRAGYHHSVYSSFVTRNPFLPEHIVSTGLQVVPGDRVIDAPKFWQQIERVRAREPQSRAISNCIFLGVHPWQKGEELERLGELMGKLSSWDDFWHCTQTEYAAFAKQRRHTKLEPTAAGHYVIERPAAYELGNAIPLTLVFDSDSIQTAQVDGAPCTLRHSEGKTYINVPHDPQHGLPTKIDETAEGTCAKFPGLKASLTFDLKTGRITYTLENTTDVPLLQAVLTISTPPAYAPGMCRWTRKELKGGDSWPVATTVSTTRTDSYWLEGKSYVPAQLDFIHNGQRGRIFTTCTINP